MPDSESAHEPVPFLTPLFPDVSVVADDYAEIVASGMFSNGGPRERALGAALAEWIGQGVRVALTANATLAIQLACSARFAADRPFALVPSFTAPAGPLGLAWCGFEPRFVDIDPVSWQPDVRDAERVLAEHPDKIAGILLTTTFGAANTDIGSWEALARRHDLSLVIDSAAGFGSSYPSGESLGARGTCEIFSLHATKPLPIGEGGALASRDADLIDVIESTKNFGYDRTRRSVRLGTNAKLPELSAALGLRQLEGYPDRLARRRAVLAGYHEQLAPLGVEFQPGDERSALAFVPALMPTAAGRDELVAELGEAAIGCRTYFDPPVHRHPTFAGNGRSDDLPVTVDVAARIVSLPVGDDMTPAVIGRVADAVRAVIHA